MSYLIPAQTIIVEQTIKDSRFIALVARASSKEDVASALQTAAHSYPAASHYCYAFIIGKPNQTTHIGMSDAGEPKGTAGKPIFTVLEHSHIGDIVAIVIRYFGGTLLGTGGLSRAYAGVVQDALQQLPTQLKVDMQFISIEIPYTLENTARYLIHEHNGVITASGYQATLTFDVNVPRDQVDNLINKLNYQSKHEAKINKHTST